MLLGIGAASVLIRQARVENAVDLAGNANSLGWQDRGPYTACMQKHYRKVVLAGAWMTIVVAVSLAADVTSLTGRFVLAAFGLVPALVVMRFWSGPPQTISQSITTARH